MKHFVGVRFNGLLLSVVVIAIGDGSVKNSLFFLTSVYDLALWFIQKKFSQTISERYTIIFLIIYLKALRSPLKI